MTKVNTMTDALVATTGLSRSIAQLEDIKKVIPTVATPTLGKVYSELKPYENKVSEVIKAIRDEFVNTRFAGAEAIEDDKGNKYIKVDDKTTLKNEVVRKIELNNDKALGVLANFGLLEVGCDVNATLTGGEAMANEVLTLVKEFAPNVAEDIKNIFAKFIVYTIVPNEQKIEALVTLGKLPADAVVDAFDVKETSRLTIKKEKE